MIFIGIIVALTVFGMFFKAVNTTGLLIACVLIVGLMAVLKHEHSDSVLSIDVISRKNRMSRFTSGYKIILSMILIAVCVVSKKPEIGLAVLIISSAILVLVAGINPKTYLRFLSVPMAFIFVGGLAIVFNYSKVPMDVLNIKLFGGFIGISEASQIQAQTVVAKAFGAMSALYVMSLTTPMSEIIRCLKKVHMPRIIIDLMYLIYRCIFIIYEMHRTMKTAAKSRGGFSSYRTGIKTTAKIYSNLLIRSYMSSSKMFDAMVARCYDGEINFLQDKKNKYLYR